MAVARLSPTPPQVAHPIGVDRLRWLLALGLLLLATGVLFYGERASTLEHLEAGVTAGDITRVEVTPGLGPGVTGHAAQQVRWRQGPFRYHTTVVEASPGTHVRDRQVRHEDIGVLLQQSRPDLEVIRTVWSPPPTNVAFGWGIPDRLATLAFFGWLCCLSLVAAGPEPWRATRWAWFWLCCSPIGALAFLLLSGRTPGLPLPKTAGRRLTGGWAFGLLLLLWALA